jgi:hypothetical protein
MGGGAGEFTVPNASAHLRSNLRPAQTATGQVAVSRDKLGILLQERLDLVEPVFVYLELRGPDDTVDLIRAPGADDGSGYCGVAEGPGYRHLRRGDAVKVPDLLLELD